MVVKVLLVPAVELVVDFLQIVPSVSVEDVGGSHQADLVVTPVQTAAFLLLLGQLYVGAGIDGLAHA